MIYPHITGELRPNNGVDGFQYWAFYVFLATCGFPRHEVLDVGEVWYSLFI